MENEISIDIGNGYHYLPKLTINTATQIDGLLVDTYLDNIRLFYLILITSLLFIISYVIQSTLMQIVANLPVLGVLTYMLIGKTKFLLLHPLHYTAISCRG
jgi:hypothetical protein